MSRRAGDTAFSTLMDFQRDTVDYVLGRLYDDGDTTDRFLVADEVGMGKTLVARGVIAGAIERLQDEPDVDRIDIIYICSNADIARQNISKLDVRGDGSRPLSTRITLLATQLRDLNRPTEDGSKTVNLVAFTPGTSFDRGNSGGKAEERALLCSLLEPSFDDDAKTRNALSRVLKMGLKEQNWHWHRSRLERRGAEPDEQVVSNFRAAVAGSAELQRLRELVEDLRGVYQLSATQKKQRTALIGELRHMLARASISCLEPDLVILDEFQRFKRLLETPSDEGEREINQLAHDLFTFKHAKVLLLSATPYKMLTLPEERELTGDDHYKDFLATVEFLSYPGHVEASAALRGALREYRERLIARDGAQEAKEDVEVLLRRVMCRTERPQLGEAQLLRDRRGDVDPPTAEDLAAYVAMRRLADEVGGALSVEYWKSAPYFLNFMDGYQLSRKVKDRLRDEELLPLLKQAPAIDSKALSDGRPIEPGNARLRALYDETIGRGLWRLLWMPPSMPYYEPAGPYAELDDVDVSKRLIFSSWAAAPSAIASILSHGAQLAMTRGKADVEGIRGRLRYNLDRGRPAGMSALAMFVPLPELAESCDPLAFARQSPDSRIGIDQVLAAAEAAVRPRLPAAPPSLANSPAASWYAAAPFLIGSGEWRHGDLTGSLAGGKRSGDEALAAHLELADEYAAGSMQLGSHPDDLTYWSALIGVAGPANCAYRAFRRVTAASSAVSDQAVREAAAIVAEGFRSLFNHPEVAALIDQLVDDGEHYWQKVLAYCLQGNLQAVLDEYLHHLVGNVSPSGDEDLLSLARSMQEAISLRTVTLRGMDTRGGDTKGLGFPSRFALRYGTAKGTLNADESSLVRMKGVQEAFNSPFWPFVLASTSIGQEGVDFHWWCHSLVHWNQPANAVDLEQREGRVHRFKGYAIRKNVAHKHRKAALRSTEPDPWAAAFAAASEDVARGEMNDLWPGWVYPGPAKVEVWLPYMPLSRDIEHDRRLQRQRALYRLAFGQPRQEDLLSMLDDHGAPADTEALKRLQIDLRPPTRARRVEEPKGDL